MKQPTAFTYKQGNSLLHRCPAWIKILTLPVVSIAAFYLPPLFSIIVITLLTLVSILLHFTFREILSDLRVVIYYAVLLIFAKIIRSFATHQSFDFKGEKETWILLLRLFSVMQCASLLFKTSTSLQIREGFARIAPKPVAEALSIFICFIPQVAKNWAQAKRAWLARGGKKSIRMLLVLLPVFFSVGMKQAYNTARAISARH